MGIDDMFLSGRDAIPFIIIMSVFVFGLLLFKKIVRIPKRLFIFAFISYILMLFIILWIYLWGKCFPDITNIFIDIIGFLCVLVILPNFFFFNFMEELIGYGFTWYYAQWPVVFQTMLYLMTFLMNILYIFLIIKLILFIKHKISAKKSQIKQAV